MHKANYNKMTDEQFQKHFEAILTRMMGTDILEIPEANSILREELNNDVLDEWLEEHPDEDLSECTDKEFDEGLEAIVNCMMPAELLAIPNLDVVLREALNDQVLDEWAEDNYEGDTDNE